jgi:hypothetical protein
MDSRLNQRARRMPAAITAVVQRRGIGSFGFVALGYNVVAYLSPADNVSRPLPYRLRRLTQPVMRPPNWFSIPRSTLLSSI